MTSGITATSSCNAVPASSHDRLGLSTTIALAALGVLHPTQSFRTRTSLRNGLCRCHNKPKSGEVSRWTGGRGEVAVAVAAGGAKRRKLANCRLILNQFERLNDSSLFAVVRHDVRYLSSSLFVTKPSVVIAECCFLPR